MAGRTRSQSQASGPDNLVSEHAGDGLEVSNKSGEELEVLKDTVEQQGKELRTMGDRVDNLSHLILGFSSQIGSLVEQVGKLATEKGRQSTESLLGPPPVQGTVPPFSGVLLSPTPCSLPLPNPHSTTFGNLMWPSSSGGPPKCRPDFPIFSGEDVHGWLYRVKQLLDFYSQPTEQHVRHASLFLDGIPLRWFRWLEKSKGRIFNWAEFEKALLMRFGPSEYLDYKGALSKLQQTGTLSEYQTQFENLSNFVEGLSEDYLVSCYVSGLREELRFDVMLRSPKTMEDACRTARLFESKLSISNPTYFKPTETIPSQPKTPSTVAMPSQSSVRRISPQEAKERRDKGLCYHCDEKYVPGHRCKTQKLFVLEGVPFNVAEEESCDWGFDNKELEGGAVT